MEELAKRASAAWRVGDFTSERLLHIVSPAFLLRNSRYAILVLTIIAAAITPTQDVVNLMLLLVPMCALYFTGVLASYALVLHREHRRFPWRKFAGWTMLAAAVAGAVAILLLARYGFHLSGTWPFLVK